MSTKLKLDTLRGQQFIGLKDDCDLPRICPNCFFGVNESNNQSGIEYAGKCLSPAAIKLFRENPLTSTLSGKQVGNYCTVYLNYSHAEEI